MRESVPENAAATGGISEIVGSDFGLIRMALSDGKLCDKRAKNVGVAEDSDQQHQEGFRVWLNVIGWTATAVFSSSCFFEEAATLLRIQASRRRPLGTVRDLDPLIASGRREPHHRDCGGLHIPTTGVGQELHRTTTRKVRKLTDRHRPPPSGRGDGKAGGRPEPLRGAGFRGFVAPDETKSMACTFRPLQAQSMG